MNKEGKNQGAFLYIPIFIIMKKNLIAEQVRRMQKIAGLISEDDYRNYDLRQAQGDDMTNLEEANESFYDRLTGSDYLGESCANADYKVVFWYDKGDKRDLEFSVCVEVSDLEWQPEEEDTNTPAGWIMELNIVGGEFYVEDSGGYEVERAMTPEEIKQLKNDPKAYDMLEKELYNVVIRDKTDDEANLEEDSDGNSLYKRVLDASYTKSGCGEHGGYGVVLYVEKEGFNPDEDEIEVVVCVKIDLEYQPEEWDTGTQEGFEVMGMEVLSGYIYLPNEEGKSVARNLTPEELEFISNDSEAMAMIEKEVYEPALKDMSNY